LKVVSVKAYGLRGVDSSHHFSLNFSRKNIMKKFNIRNRVSQALLAASVTVATTVPAHAADGWDAFLDAVDLSGLSPKVVASGLLIIAIAIAYKGPDLAKRIVRKV
jgi:hypothetical protein